MKRFNYLLLFTLLSLCCVNLRAQNEPFRTNVYEMNYDGSKYYRIPALVTADDGTLVAVADKRGDKLGDLPNNISVVCRRSTDNGETWSTPIMIAEGKGEGQGYGDPLVIEDRDTKKLICIFAGGRGLWESNQYNRITINQSESTDNGLSWSTPKDITDDVNPGNWYGAFAGSGHGLQLQNGRLMFVVAARLTPDWGGTLTNYAVYSDDHGQTWEISSPVAGKGDEAKVVELENGDVLMSIRNPLKNFRKFAVSKDKGQTWEEPTINPDLKDPACNGDIIRYSTSAEGQSILLQSLPNSSSVRENVTVYASFDEGQTWKTKKLITDGYSAYSTLTVLNNGEIGMIVENGKWDENLPGEDGFVLEFVRFSKEWLLDEEEQGGEELPKGVLACNGVDRYMRIPNSPDFFPTAGGDYTVTCKVKLPGFIAGSDMRFVTTRGYEGTDNSQTSGYELFGGNGYYQAYSVNLSMKGKPWGVGHSWSTGFFPLNSWVHLAWTINGQSKQSTIYVNGQEVGYKSVEEYATNEWANALDVLVGAGYTNVNGSECVPSFFATAEIDDVRFFNKHFTPAEISADLETAVDATTPNLVAAYDFENIEGTTVPDISGKGHNGILVNYPSQTVKYTVNITTPDATEGTLRVLDGTKEIGNGLKVAAGTTLTVEATPTENYNLESINVNGVAIEGNTFVLNEDATISATFSKKESGEPEYAIPNPIDNSRSSGDRLIKDILFQGATVDGTDTPFTVDVTNTTEVYLDRTDLTMNATAGDVINTSWTFRQTCYWMCYYIYIDYDHDGVFNTENELVSFTHFNPDEKGGGQWVNSLGEVNNGPADPIFESPAFTIPADLKDVKTRVRFKADWNSKNPCGSTEQSIGSNRGTIVDFNINIKGNGSVTPDPDPEPDPEPGTIEYCIPEFSGDAHWANEAYVKTIYVGDQTYNDVATSRQFYNNTGLTVDVAQGDSVVVRYEGNNLGAYNEDQALQDLRYDIAVMFIDWNHDGLFEYCEKLAGKATPDHNVGGNMDVLDITKNIVIPADATTGIARVRMSYINAWDGPAKEGIYDSYACSAPSGIVYDFDINIVEKEEPAAPIEYCIPELSGDAHWANEAYVKTIYVGDQTYNDVATSRQFYNNTGLTVDVPQGQSVTVRYEANNLGGYNEGTVLQDLRFDIAVMFIDWDHDGIFEFHEKLAGKATPDHNVGGNMDVLDITKTIEVPATATTGVARVRMSYINAWDEPAKQGIYDSYACSAPSGIVYDFDINVVKGEAPVDKFYTLTIESDENISAVNVIDMTSGELVNSGDKVKGGTELKVAIDKGQYTIDQVLINGEVLTLDENDEATFVMKADTKLQVLVKYCTISYPMAIKGGSLMINNLSADGAVVEANTKVPYGSSISVLPLPNEEEGYYLEYIKINDEDKTAELGELGSYDADILTDWNIQVKFGQDIIEFAVGDEFGEKANGSIEVKSEDGVAVNSGDAIFQGETLTVTLIPEEGYEVEQFTKATDDNEAVVIDPAEYKDNVYSLKVDAKYILLNATFKKSVGINNNIADGIYYDAAAQTLTIPANATAEVFDIAGNKIMNIEQQTISVSTIADGCYIVRVVTEASVKTVKFIKK